MAATDRGSSTCSIVKSDGSQESCSVGEVGRRLGIALSKRKKKFVASRCNCGTYAILFESSTMDNPNRLFFGCAAFKAELVQGFLVEQGEVLEQAA
ncbi:hypothetical protein PIB30_028594 [Stylosanthes scabra]|uniref:Uncharacterized protein n=1 Tax=Stylosanthes scabra TaxID=79078 RepID=A0ABU6X8J9_9FABA|nr:hypothetical protein [Stylosanthes scabra]